MLFIRPLSLILNKCDIFNPFNFFKTRTTHSISLPIIFIMTDMDVDLPSQTGKNQEMNIDSAAEDHKQHLPW
jgi:hypothetical protein